MQDIHNSHFFRETKKENNQLKKKHGYLIILVQTTVFRSTLLIGHYHGGSLEITLKVLLIMG